MLRIGYKFTFPTFEFRLEDKFVRLKDPYYFKKIGAKKSPLHLINPDGINVTRRITGNNILTWNDIKVIWRFLEFYQYSECELRHLVRLSRRRRHFTRIEYVEYEKSPYYTFVYPSGRIIFPFSFTDLQDDELLDLFKMDSEATEDNRPSWLYILSNSYEYPAIRQTLPPNDYVTYTVQRIPDRYRHKYHLVPFFGYTKKVVERCDSVKQFILEVQLANSTVVSRNVPDIWMFYQPSIHPDPTGYYVNSRLIAVASHAVSCAGCRRPIYPYIKSKGLSKLMSLRLTEKYDVEQLKLYTLISDRKGNVIEQDILTQRKIVRISTSLRVTTPYIDISPLRIFAELQPRANRLRPENRHQELEILALIESMRRLKL